MMRVVARVLALVLMAAGPSAAAATAVSESASTTTAVGGGRFVTTWDTSEHTTVQLDIYGQVDVSISWGDGSSQHVSELRDLASAEPIAHQFTDGEASHQVTVIGTFPRFTGRGRSGPRDLLSVDEWGPTGTTDLSRAFAGMSDLTEVAEVPPGVTDMSGMFAHSTFDHSIREWDVSQVTDMSRMFRYGSFNQDIAFWDVGNVTDMSSMFAFNQRFDQPIGGWDTSRVTRIDWMFAGSRFNQAIGAWDVSGVTREADMQAVFRNATLFNHDLSSWCVPTIREAPWGFDEGATAWTSLRPTWGTCGDVDKPDTTAPTGTFGSVSGTGGVLRLRGTATDDRGVRNVAVGIRNLATGAWLHRDGTWGAFQKLYTALGDKGGSWTGWRIHRALPRGTYGVTLLVVDTSGNRNPAPRPWRRVTVTS